VKSGCEGVPACLETEDGINAEDTEDLSALTFGGRGGGLFGRTTLPGWRGRKVAGRTSTEFTADGVDLDGVEAAGSMGGSA